MCAQLQQTYDGRFVPGATSGTIMALSHFGHEGSGEDDSEAGISELPPQGACHVLVHLNGCCRTWGECSNFAQVRPVLSPGLDSRLTGV